MRVVRRLAAGIAALAGLAALVAGAPVLLLEVGGNPLPTALPTVDEVVAALTGPDDGALVLRGLAWLGWIAWATFAVSVLLEIPARLRGRRAARLPGLRLQQRLAAALIGAIVAVFVGGTVASAAVPAARPPGVVATATIPDTVSGPALARATAATTATAAATATPTAARTTAQVVVQRPVYVVKRGDYLGVIAQRFTGDFDRYHQIAALNPKLIRNPDLIRPGWRLTLPVDAHDHGKRHHATGRLVTPATKPGKPATPTPPPPAAQPGVTQPEASPAAGTPAARTPEKEEVSAVLTVAAALTAAGVLAGHALLWRRRVVRVHRHYLGRRRVTAVRYPMTPVNPVWTPADPEPEAAVATVAMQVVEPPRWPNHAAAELLDASLRRLALGLRGRAPWTMPDIFAAWHYGGELGVVLASPCPDPPEPYSARSPDTWALPGGELLPGAAEAPSLLPGLVTLGTWPEGGELLVDSERTGLLTLVGDPENCDDLLRHLAAEAATATWADTAAVLVAGFSAADTRAIGALNETRVRSIPSVADALARVARRAVVNRAVLRESGTPDTMAARVNDTSGSLWTTHVLFVADPWGQHTEAIEDLDAQLAELGRVGVCVIATHPTGTRWTVTVDAAGSLDMPFLGFSDTVACRLTAAQLGALSAAIGNPEYAAMPIAGARHRIRS